MNFEILRPNSDSILFNIVSVENDVNKIFFLTKKYIPIVVILVAIIANQTRPNLWVYSIVFLMIMITSNIKRKSHISESLLAVRNLGIQLTSKDEKNRLVYQKFIPSDDIDQIIILEGLTAVSVIVYLAIDVSHDPNLVIPFSNFEEIPLDVFVSVRNGLKEIFPNKFKI